MKCCCVKVHLYQNSKGKVSWCLISNLNLPFLKKETQGTLPGAPPFYSVDSSQISSSVHSITDRRIEECNMFICNSMGDLMEEGWRRSVMCASITVRGIAVVQKVEGNRTNRAQHIVICASVTENMLRKHNITPHG